MDGLPYSYTCCTQSNAVCAALTALISKIIRSIHAVVHAAIRFDCSQKAHRHSLLILNYQKWRGKTTRIEDSTAMIDIFRPNEREMSQITLRNRPENSTLLAFFTEGPRLFSLVGFYVGEARHKIKVVCSMFKFKLII